MLWNCWSNYSIFINEGLKMSYTKEDEDREIKEFIKKNKNVRYVGIVGVDIPDISRFLIPDLVTKKKKIEVERQIKVIP